MCFLFIEHLYYCLRAVTPRRCDKRPSASQEQPWPPYWCNRGREERGCGEVVHVHKAAPGNVVAGLCICTFFAERENETRSPATTPPPPGAEGGRSRRSLRKSRPGSWDARATDPPPRTHPFAEQTATLCPCVFQKVCGHASQGLDDKSA